MSLFENVNFDPDRFQRDMREKIGARQTYCIFFTPRSGSSWLTDVVGSSRKMGRPEEYFNPNFVPNIANRINADNMINYTKMAKRHLHFGGIFGFEVTYYQILKAVGEEAFSQLFPNTTKTFYLIREDIVLQAVSLAKAVNTSVFHSVSASDDQIREADTAFIYDGKEIDRWLEHILDQEKKFQVFFGTYGYQPNRISYEKMMAAGREKMIRYFSKQLGVALDEESEVAERHRKIGSNVNSEFADRYREEFAKKITRIDSERLEYLSAIPPLKT